ncbi:NACHT domain-containing protein [Algoriphagus terrigena]|uniref:NACHT domain-containing protein n=1 Tax=Algoriphagus terrigena TaxID=344884 RepID=UPI00040E6D65|nr:NACHT domain-containing protein [Algoriphagus terrigena]
MRLRNIEVLEKDSNKKGDLFGRLMSDLFHTLGYDEPRLNIHKSGREIDLNSYHRTEPKIAIAECKAHAEPIGGADINKFVGVVDAEKRKIKKEKIAKGFSVVGYFISLSGFKETAIEQEKEFNNGRVILIKPDKIVEELIRGRVLVSKEKAISALASAISGLTLLDYSDLLAYDKGWVWAFYYSETNGQKPSHFALVHAEGKPLIKDLAEGIINIDSNIKKIFSGLTLLNNDKSTDNAKQKLIETVNRYYKYLESELGEIHFEGLPTDKEAGSVKVKLENIFVPLHLSSSQKRRKKDEFDIDESTRESIGEILNNKSRLAILAKPGGGKSTLIKRIAIAYAFPERRKQINDSLPDKDWFPIFLRCRELGDKVTLSITDIINGIPNRAEIPSCAIDFSILVSNALQNGNALLLIDGLDEIAEDKNRIAFVNQLRTFIATYPTINIIVTSREAGFRVVAGSLATYCENYTVSNLLSTDIEELCLKWHIAIIDESESTIREANKLSQLILKDNRIKVLAENPLLLTTLLFVKRWAGYLPTKRSVLYQEMIKLLLVTWNVEGHEILDIEEAEPQLAFVAYWMTKNGQQTITADELNSCLIDARKQMPEILGYTKINPSEFIKRVESRSSLLIMAGHKRLDSGILSAVYEFLHLSFQEYLTAKAIVKKYIPVTDIKSEVVDIIKANVNNENWKEVIPLAAVLLERDTKDLIEFLISESKVVALKEKKERKPEDKLAPSLLGSCLANEIQINPELLGTAIEWYAKNTYSIRDRGNTEIILKNKFGTIFRERVKECFFEKYDDKYSSPIGSTLADIFLNDLRNPENKNTIPNEILLGLQSSSKEDKCTAILGMMGFAFGISRPRTKSITSISQSEEIFSILLNLLKTNDLHYHFSVCWCLAWAGEATIFPESLRVSFVAHLTKSWVMSMDFNLHRVTSWALCKILTPRISKSEISKIPKLKASINENFSKPINEFDKLLSIYLGSLIGINFDKKEVTEIFKRQIKIGGERLDYPNTFSLFAKALDISLKDVNQIQIEL